MSDLAEIFYSLPPEQQQALLNGPALAPPAGIVSNFENPPNSNTLVLAVVTVGLVVSAIFLLIRFYSRLFCIKKVFIEDFLVVAAFGLYIGYDWAVYRLIGLTGLFVHQWDIQLKTISEFEYLIYLGSNFAGPALLCIRAAIILDWIKIFVPTGTRNAFFWTSYILLGIVVTFYVAIIFAENLSCIPREKIWDPLVPGGHCISQQALITAVSSINLVADLTILVLPQMVIWKLHMSTSKKVGISFIFAVALLNVAVAAIRISTSVGYLHTTDATYQVGTVILAGFAELTLLFIVACVPSVPKAFGSLRNLYASIKSTIRTSGNRGTHESDPTGSLPLKKYQQINEDILDRGAGGVEVEVKNSRTDSDIVRTTEFLATEGYNSDTNDTDFLRQHPWIEPPST